jgi:hypothetical protein
MGATLILFTLLFIAIPLLVFGFAMVCDEFFREDMYNLVIKIKKNRKRILATLVFYLAIISIGVFVGIQLSKIWYL